MSLSGMAYVERVEYHYFLCFSFLNSLSFIDKYLSTAILKVSSNLDASIAFCRRSALSLVGSIPLRISVFSFWASSRACLSETLGKPPNPISLRLLFMSVLNTHEHEPDLDFWSSSPLTPPTAWRVEFAAQSYNRFTSNAEIGDFNIGKNTPQYTLQKYTFFVFTNQDIH